jgi:membrane protein HdeD
MNWRLQTTLAGILAVLGLWIIFNPVTLVSAAASVIPLLLLVAGAVQLVSILFRSRRLIRLIVVPAVTGALFIYAGLSMKFGDPKTVGPISLIFVLALVLFGSGAAKLVTGASMRRSRYFAWVIGSAAVSMLMGLLVLFNWETVSANWIGVFLGAEMIADAIVMAVLALRDRDGEAAMETLGLDPVAEAAKAEARREAAAATAAAEAAAIRAATLAAEQKAAALAAAVPPPPLPRPAPIIAPPPPPVMPAPAPVAAPEPVPVVTPQPAPKPAAKRKPKPAADAVPKPAAAKPAAKRAPKPPKPAPEDDSGTLL